MSTVPDRRVTPNRVLIRSDGVIEIMADITVCTKDCPDACSLAVSMDSQGKLTILGNPDHPFTSGFVCPKIRDHMERLQSEHRILHPLLRKGNEWETITWNKALDICAEKIQSYRHEPTSILHIQGSGPKKSYRVWSEKPKIMKK